LHINILHLLIYILIPIPQVFETSVPQLQAPVLLANKLKARFLLQNTVWLRCWHGLLPEVNTHATNISLQLKTKVKITKQLRRLAGINRSHSKIPWEHVPYLSASPVVIHYEEALYQVYVSFTFTLPFTPEFASQKLIARTGGVINPIRNVRLI